MKCTYAIAMLMLLLAGDVELNPGPVCPSCNLDIHPAVQTLKCTQCSKSTHKPCSFKIPNGKSYCSNCFWNAVSDMVISRLGGKLPAVATPVSNANTNMTNQQQQQQQTPQNKNLQNFHHNGARPKTYDSNQSPRQAMSTPRRQFPKHQQFQNNQYQNNTPNMNFYQNNNRRAAVNKNNARSSNFNNFNNNAMINSYRNQGGRKSFRKPKFPKYAVGANRMIEGLRPVEQIPIRKNSSSVHQ